MKKARETSDMVGSHRMNRIKQTIRKIHEIRCEKKKTSDETDKTDLKFVSFVSFDDKKKNP